MAADGALDVPRRGRQRGADEAPVRQPLRHGPVHRSTASCARRTSSSRVARSSSPATAGSAAASPSRFDGLGARVAIVEVDPVRAIEALMDGHQVMNAARRRALGRGLHHRDRQPQRVPRGALPGHARRRGPGEQRPLRRGAGARGAGAPGRGPHPRGPQATSRSTTSARRSSTSWPRAGSSTSAPPRAIRPRSWT